MKLHHSLAFTLTLLIVSLFPPAVMSQEWTWQNPLPQGNALNAIQFVDANNGWAVGDMGTILHSTDGGKTWDVQNSGTQKDLAGVYFVDKNTGWIIGKYDWNVLHTVNSGKTWSERTLDRSSAKEKGDRISEFRSLTFVDANIGWIAGRKSRLYTTNGGITWNEKPLGGKFAVYEAFHFTDLNNGWAVKARFISAYSLPGIDIMQTSDGGTTWNRKDTMRYDRHYCINFIDHNNGWIVSSGEDFVYFRKTTVITGDTITILHTTDGGGTWSTDKLGDLSETQIRCISFVDADHGWMVGVHGIYHTTNGGKSWTKQVIENPSGISGIDFANSFTGWLTNRSTILRTNDAGTEWINIDGQTRYKLNSVIFSDTSNGWTVGAHGTILHTTNEGVNWNRQISGTSDTLRRIACSDAKNCWAVGDSGTILHTNDGGSTWHKQVTGTTFNLYGVAFADANNGWVVGNRKHSEWIVAEWLRKTVAWVSCYFDLTRIIPKQYLFTHVNYTNIMLHTTNGGASWDGSVLKNYYSLNGICFSNSSNGWIVGSYGTFLHTTNGGSTWLRWERPIHEYHGTDRLHAFIQLDKESIQFFDCIHFIDTANGWAVGKNNVAHTTNGGATWNIDFGEFEKLSISFVDDFNGWLTGEGGMIVQTTNRGQTWNFPRPVRITTNTIYDVAFVDKNHGWAVGDNGTILHYGNNNSKR